jgi:hypothetical protein
VAQTDATKAHRRAAATANWGLRRAACLPLAVPGCCQDSPVTGHRGLSAPNNRLPPHGHLQPYWQWRTSTHHARDAICRLRVSIAATGPKRALIVAAHVTELPSAEWHATIASAAGNTHHLLKLRQSRHRLRYSSPKPVTSAALCHQQIPGS